MVGKALDSASSELQRRANRQDRTIRPSCALAVRTARGLLEGKCMTKAFLRSVVAVSAALWATGAFAQDAPPEPTEIDSALADAGDAAVIDPWEGFNRQVFKLNNAIDDALLVPAAKAYRATTPKVGRRGIRRFLDNLRTPGVLVNDVLQGEFGRAGKTLSRFVVNSTIGAGGFADPAAQLGVEGHKEDFGQTLAVWGVGSGPYLVLPFLGPSSPRDAFGSAVGIGLNPLFYVRTPPASAARLALGGVGAVSAREQFIDPLAEIEAKSLDYYASLRSFYLQSRKREIANGVVDYSDLPDFDEFEEFEELQ
jgi:phospholipid-binding lipoprotein MlaA